MIGPSPSPPRCSFSLVETIKMLGRILLGNLKLWNFFLGRNFDENGDVKEDKRIHILSKEAMSFGRHSLGSKCPKELIQVYFGKLKAPCVHPLKAN